MKPPTHEKPATLREIAGASSVPAPLAQSVLLIIDAQKIYTEGILPLSGIGPSIDALARFLARARAAGVPVIHVVHRGMPGGKARDPQGRFEEIIDKVKPAENEVVVEKRFPSGFTQTTLGAELERIGRKDLIVAGYMTHMCLNSTTRAATEAGYRCTVVSELTATRDLPDGKGGVVPAATVKLANLASLADRFAIVVETGDDLR